MKDRTKIARRQLQNSCCVYGSHRVAKANSSSNIIPLRSVLLRFQSENRSSRLCTFKPHLQPEARPNLLPILDNHLEIGVLPWRRTHTTPPSTLSKDYFHRGAHKHARYLFARVCEVIDGTDDLHIASLAHARPPALVDVAGRVRTVRG